MIKRRHSSNSNIPIFDSKTSGSDSDTLKSTGSLIPSSLTSPYSSTRLPSYQQSNNKNRFPYSSRKCVSSNVTPISSPLIPKSRFGSPSNNNNNSSSNINYSKSYKNKNSNKNHNNNNNNNTNNNNNNNNNNEYSKKYHKLPQQQFSKEVIESSAQLIKDIDTTLTQLSQQYYSDNNNTYFSPVSTPINCEHESATTPTSKANNNSFTESLELNDQHQMLNKLKLKKYNEQNNNNAATVAAATTIPHQTNIPSPQMKLKSSNSNRPNRLNSVDPKSLKGQTKKSKLSSSSQPANSYTEAWIYNSRLPASPNPPGHLHFGNNLLQYVQPENDLSTKINKSSTNHNPTYQSSSSSGSELLQKSNTTSNNKEKTQQLKFPQQFFVNGKISKERDDEVALGIPNRDSGISSSKESWLENSNLSNGDKRSNLPQPPPRISSLKCPTETNSRSNSVLKDYISTAPETASNKHVSKADKRKARELYASVKQRDEVSATKSQVKVTKSEPPPEINNKIEIANEKLSTVTTPNSDMVEEYQSDADGHCLKTSGYVSDNNSDNGNLGIYAQKMQQRFKEGLLAVQESLQITTNTDSTNNSIIATNAKPGHCRDDLSSTSSDEIEDYLKDLSLRLGASTNLSPQKSASVISSSSNSSSRRSSLSKRNNVPTSALLNGRENEIKEKLYQKRLEQYANDLEPASDFDITSSCSMDLLTGKAVSDDCEPVEQYSDVHRPPINYEHPPTNHPHPPFGGGLGDLKRGSFDSKLKQDNYLPSNKRTVPRRDFELLESAGPSPATMEDNITSDGNCNSHYRAMSLPGRPSRIRTNSATWQHPLEINTNIMTTVTNSCQRQPTNVYYEVPANASNSGSTSQHFYRSVNHYGPPSSATTGSSSNYSNARQYYPSGSCTPISLMNVRLPYATISHGGNVNPAHGGFVRPSTSTSSLGGRREDGGDDIYEGLGSRLSLLSSGSYRSLNEERQATEIRRLRRELEMAQQKVKSLSGQLSSNGNLVNAFENSLQSMSLRLHKFAATSESKENELNELKNTIHELKKQASSSPIQNDQVSPKIYAASSLTSLSSNSNSTDKRSDGSLKKSSWLKSSIGRAFRKKSSSSNKDEGSSESINEMHRKSNNIMSISESESLQVLRKELEEKDARLTDVQLDALSRSHQLEQLRDLLTKMRYEMSSLKADNSRLQNIMAQSNIEGVSDSNKISNGSTGSDDDSTMTAGRAKSAKDPIGGSNKTKFDFLNALVKEREPCESLLVSVTFGIKPNSSKENNQSTTSSGTSTIPIGRVGISPNTSWSDLETQLKRLLKEYLSSIDPNSGLGLNGEAISRYRIDEEPFISVCSTGSMRPLTSPLGTTTSKTNGPHTVLLELKSCVHGNSIDDLVFQCLVPKPILQRYLGLLYEHRKVILCGPSGTGKSFLARKLADNLIYDNGPGNNSVFVVNVDNKSSRELKVYMSALADQLSRSSDQENSGGTNTTTNNLPSVIILENLHYVSSFSEIFSSFLSIQNNKSPFVIGTMSLSNSNTGCNLQLHHNFRWILLTNHMEPVKGFLSRYLRRRLLHHHIVMNDKSTTNSISHIKDEYDSLLHVTEWLCVVWHHVNKFIESHSSAGVTMGPRLFLDCPMQLEPARAWFLDLWNFSIVPYILEAVRDGLVTQGRRQSNWDDPTDWLVRSWPWPTPMKGNSDVFNLIHLRPEDVGFDTYQLVAMPNMNNHSNNIQCLQPPVSSDSLSFYNQSHAYYVDHHNHHNQHQHHNYPSANPNSASNSNPNNSRFFPSNNSSNSINNNNNINNNKSLFDKNMMNL